MKTYYALLCSAPRHSALRALAEPLFVLGCVVAICAVMWLVK